MIVRRNIYLLCCSRSRRSAVTGLLWLLPVLITCAQENTNAFWNQRTLSGEVSLEGRWRQQKSFYSSSYEDWRSLYGIAGFKLFSSSYLWVPSLMTLDVDLEFNPETRRERYIVIPDRAEVRTLEKVGVRSVIFNSKAVTVMPFYNYHQSFFNRENLTNVRSGTSQWGGSVLIRNRILPVTLSYNDLNWRQKETETGRLFTNDRKTFEGRTSWHLFEHDKNELTYGYDDFRYTYTDVDTTHNRVNRVTLSNRIVLDTASRYTFRSLVNYFDQTGTYDFTRLDIYERFRFKLPHNFRLNTLYNYYSFRDRQSLQQHRISAGLDHKLYLSLRTQVFGEYYKTHQTAYDETNVRAGAGFDYTKKVGRKNRLDLSYHYFRRHLDAKGSPEPIQVVNEQHTLRDGVPELLERPYAERTSLVVKDITGTVIYQENMDYLLIDRNDFIEIQRIPGGRIPDGGVVLIDYTATQPGDYRYNLNHHSFRIGFVLFDRLLEVYYRLGVQDYSNIYQTGFLTLKTYHQNVVGIRMDKGFARGGVEYDNFNSNIIPYHMMRYYLNIQKNIKNKFFLTLNASLRDYKYTEDNSRQKLGNVSGMFSYTLVRSTKISLETGYLRHKAYLTDLRMWTGRLEASTVFRQLYLSAGFDFYNRDYRTSRFVMNGVYLRVTRKFSEQNYRNSRKDRKQK